MKKLYSLILGVLAIGFASLLYAAPVKSVDADSLDIHRIVAFGDSLSDNGNVYLLTKKMHKISPDSPVIPASELYWNGRFSDGPVWFEYLGALSHITPFRFEAANCKEDDCNTEYSIDDAYGGAWAEPNEEEHYKNSIANRNPMQLAQPKTSLFHMTLDLEVDNFIFQTTVDSSNNFHEVLSHDLIFIWIGGNDYLNQGMDTPPMPRPAEEATTLVIQAVHDNIAKLVDAGATNFFILGLPDLSKTPDVALRDPEGKALAPQMALTSKLHNKKLRELVANLSREFPAARFNFFALDTLFDDAVLKANQRAVDYAKNHEGLAQKSGAPCLLESTDPDPSKTRLYFISPLLAETIAPQFLSQQAQQTYRQCDLHLTYDQQSPFNFLQDYNAGGVFFDHIHPLTQIHAEIALDLCRSVTEKGYRFVDPTTHELMKADCESYGVDQLVQHMVDPPFPLTR